MKNYIALLFGSGGTGCDYTIGCNKDFRKFKAEDDENAIKECKKIWEDFGCSNIGEQGMEYVHIEKIELFCTDDQQILVPVQEWNDEDRDMRKRLQLEKELRIAQNKIDELKLKMQ